VMLRFLFTFNTFYVQIVFTTTRRNFINILNWWRCVVFLFFFAGRFAESVGNFKIKKFFLVKFSQLIRFGQTLSHLKELTELTMSRLTPKLKLRIGPRQTCNRGGLFYTTLKIKNQGAFGTCSSIRIGYFLFSNQKEKFY